MLRIHVEPGPDGLTLRLEGKLVDSWVDELARVWMDLLPRLESGRSVRVDLGAVSFVDARGRAMLAALRRLGCELHGSGPFISAVIEEASSDRHS